MRFILCAAALAATLAAPSFLRPQKYTGSTALAHLRVTRASTASAGQAVQPSMFEAVQPDLFGAGGTFTNAWADYDGDGDLDLFVGFDVAANRLYRNDKGTFVDAAPTAGVADIRATRAAAWGDFDGDRDPDLLIGFAPGGESVLRLYRNDGGRFTDGTEAAGLIVGKGAVRQPVWVDFDGDADLDLFIGFRDRANAMFRNSGGRFTDIAPDIGLADARRTVGAVWFDFDEDGDLDVAVANMDGDANGLFRNDAGRFTDVAATPETAGLEWGGRTPQDKTNGTVRVCAADVNTDGHVDLFMANYGKNGLFLNRDKGRFEYAAVGWGVDIDGRYDSCAFGDMDNDGDLDLYVNGTVTGGTSYRDYLFRNTGSRFEDITPDQIRDLHADHGVQWADYDGDGDLDLALTGAQKNGMHLLFRNMLPPSAAGRSLRVKVIDEKDLSTLAGARVTIRPAGSRRIMGSQIVDAGSGYDSQNDMPVHFGLPTLDPLDVNVVYWRNGAMRVFLHSKMDPRRWQGRVFEMKVR